LSQKITKEIYHAFLKDSFEKATSDPDKVKGLSFQVLEFLTKNYLNMTTEMQEIADKVIDASIEIIDSSLKNAPDTKEYRASKRQLRTLKRNLPSAISLITGLEQKSGIKEPIINETRVLFEKHFQVFLDAVYDAMEGTHEGSSYFAIISMFCMCIDELVTAFHLAQHGFANQAYTHIRTVIENLNLVELFMKDDSFADLWCSGDEKAKARELSPKEVRKKLGIKNDPVYRFLSAHGPHGTFDSIRSKSARKHKQSANGNPEIHFFLGGTKIVVHLISANCECIQALSLALASVGKAFPDRIHSEDYIGMVKEMAREYKEYITRHVVPFFKESGVDTRELEDFMNGPFINLLNDQLP
jgi:hypothetical protein